jgi:imidazole glycerol-phosphate synthase subunit HisH
VSAPATDRPRIAVLDYGIGNLRSAQKALEHVGAHASLTDDASEVAEADAVVMPGVGAFGACMDALRAAGLDRVALDAVASGRPFLGICVGMQMLFDASTESPGVAGLGVFPGTIERLADGVKRPQMQWNLLRPRAADPLLDGLGDAAWVYFVHSYAAPDSASCVATCEYGGDVVAVVRREQVWATQFHPEKSGEVGLHLLANFVALARSAQPGAV